MRDSDDDHDEGGGGGAGDEDEGEGAEERKEGASRCGDRATEDSHLPERLLAKANNFPLYLSACSLKEVIS